MPSRSRHRSPRKVGGLVRGVDLVKGNLSKYGYHDVKYKSVAARHAALNRAVRAYGKNKVLQSLAARVKLNMAAKHNDAADAMFADLQWLA